MPGRGRGGGLGATHAELVGSSGRVTAVEVAPDLTARSRANLAHLPRVEVVQADGGEHDPGPADAILVNGGATHPRRLWLDSLRSGGRLLLPLTGPRGNGGVLKLVKRDTGYTAHFICSISIFPCVGARHADGERLLAEAFERGGWAAVRSLRRDAHPADPSCWLHGDDLCLSTLDPELGNAPARGGDAPTSRRPS